MPIGFVLANLSAMSFQTIVLSIYYTFKYSDLSPITQVERSMQISSAPPAVYD